jgi:hypothetical protein
LGEGVCEAEKEGEGKGSRDEGKEEDHFEVFELRGI